MIKTDMDRQLAKFTPKDCDGELALKLFAKIWPTKMEDGALVLRGPVLKLNFDGKTFRMWRKTKKRQMDDEALEHEMRKCLEVFNMVLTMRLPIYSYPELRVAVRKTQDELGHKYVKAVAQLQGLARQLPHAEHSAKWGYACPVLDPLPPKPVPKTVNKDIKAKRKGKK